jgi:16S rRNA (guanine(966)-N(2))-methyltransferase RsmD
MRIIAGKYRGSKLNTLEGLKTRPTLDGTKEAIFSSLGGYIPGFVVLDIFGGSGALSLESLSRGAVKAYIIDNNIDAINIIKSNAAKLKVGNELVVYHAEYKNVLEKMKHMKFDLVFIDPPFRMKVIDEIINFLICNDMIAEEGYIMAEYPMEDVVEKQYDGFNVKLCRRYSSSEVLILEKE